MQVKTVHGSSELLRRMRARLGALHDLIRTAAAIGFHENGPPEQKQNLCQDRIKQAPRIQEILRHSELRLEQILSIEMCSPQEASLLDSSFVLLEAPALGARAVPPTGA